MALESIGKRSIRNEFENAGGDHSILTKNSETLNFEMAERGTSNPQGSPESDSNRYFGGLIGNRELGGLAILSVCLYLVNGEYAQSVCTALTSVPPAMFSYRVLVNQQTTKQGYHSILFYWTLYGIIALVDQFVGNAQGYNLCKSGLLGVVFLHSIRMNSSALPDSWRFIDQASTDILTTIFSRYDAENFLPKTPTMTQFSDDDSFDYQLEETRNPDISTACSFLPSLEMQTTQKLTTGLKSTQRNSQPQANSFQTMSAMTMTCGPADIVTVPANSITFSGDQREQMIQVTNVSPLHVMFALKTNADTYLIAAPTSGVLFSGQSMTMRVGVTDNCFDDSSDHGSTIDKLAIDYASIPAPLSSAHFKFSQEFFQSQNRRRLAIRVFYQ